MMTKSTLTRSTMNLKDWAIIIRPKRAQRSNNPTSPRQLRDSSRIITVMWPSPQRTGLCTRMTTTIKAKAMTCTIRASSSTKQPRWLSTIFWRVLGAICRQSTANWNNFLRRKMMHIILAFRRSRRTSGRKLSRNREAICRESRRDWIRMKNQNIPKMLYELKIMRFYMQFILNVEYTDDNYIFDANSQN